MSFDFIKEKAAETAEDVKEGLIAMNRFVLRRDVRSRTVLTDKKNNTKLYDTEREQSREYSVLKLFVGAVAGVIGVALVAASLKKSAARKSLIKRRNRELKRLRKLCKEAKIDIKEKKDSCPGGK